MNNFSFRKNYIFWFTKFKNFYKKLKLFFSLSCCQIFRKLRTFIRNLNAENCCLFLNFCGKKIEEKNRKLLEIIKQLFLKNKLYFSQKWETIRDIKREDILEKIAAIKLFVEPYYKIAKSLFKKCLPYLAKYKLTILVLFLILFFYGCNVISPILYKNYFAVYNRIEISLAERGLFSEPTDFEINKRNYKIKLLGATGYLENVDSYILSPNKYAINSYIEDKIENKKEKNVSGDVEIEKKILPGKKDFKTSLLVVEDSYAKYEKAEVSLKKLSKKEKVNVILTCSDGDFDYDNNYCKNWQVFTRDFKDEDGYISFDTEHFSVYAGAYLEILNVQSNLTSGDNWEVFFNTYGESDLFIEPVEETVYGEDLEFIDFYCGEEKINDVFNGEKMVINDYVCEEKTSRIVNKTLTGGKHKLKFTFGSSVVYAQNFACDSTSGSTCIVSTSQNVDGETIENPAGCGGNCTSLEI